MICLSRSRPLIPPALTSNDADPDRAGVRPFFNCTKLSYSSIIYCGVGKLTHYQRSHTTEVVGSNPAPATLFCVRPVASRCAVTVCSALNAIFSTAGMAGQFYAVLLLVHPLARLRAGYFFVGSSIVDFCRVRVGLVG